MGFGVPSDQWLEKFWRPLPRCIRSLASCKYEVRMQRNLKFRHSPEAGDLLQQFESAGKIWS